jgi:hypothetical protein
MAAMAMLMIAAAVVAMAMALTLRKMRAWTWMSWLRACWWGRLTTSTLVVVMMGTTSFRQQALTREEASDGHHQAGGSAPHLLSRPMGAAIASARVELLRAAGDAALASGLVVHWQWAVMTMAALCLATMRLPPGGGSALGEEEGEGEGPTVLGCKGLPLVPMPLVVRHR